MKLQQQPSISSIQKQTFKGEHCSGADKEVITREKQKTKKLYHLPHSIGNICIFIKSNDNKNGGEEKS